MLECSMVVEVVREADHAQPYGVIARLAQLRDLLVVAPRTLPEVAAALPDDYAEDAASSRRLRRDLASLRHLGYSVRRYEQPLRWAIEHAIPLLSDADVEALTYIRTAFTEHHPLSPQIQKLLDRLTTQLPPAQQRIWEREPAWRLALQPAIDYSAASALIAQLDDAIRRRRQVALLYRSPGRPAPILHPRLDPYDLEYVDRHFYLSAYSYRFGAILTFRLDRIVDDPARESPRLLNDTQQPRRQRPPIHFTYRLAAALADGGVSERFTIHTTRREGDHVIVEASDTSEFRIVRVLLAYGEKALLLNGPPTLLERMRAAVAQMARAYNL